jgi:ketosteroid isomerase-like protein
VTDSPNVKLVRTIYSDWERGDFSATRWAHPEIELVIADGPEPGRHKGLAAMAEHWRGFLGAWEGYRVRADEYRELGDGQVLVLLRATGGRGRSSGVELGRTDEEGANVFQIIGGKVTRLVVYFDSEHAHAGPANVLRPPRPPGA